MCDLCFPLHNQSRSYCHDPRYAVSCLLPPRCDMASQKRHQVHCKYSSTSHHICEFKEWLLLVLRPVLRYIISQQIKHVHLSPFRIMRHPHFYRPQRSWAKVMFLQACVCPQGGGVSASVHAGMPLPRTRHPPGPDTPPDQTHTPSGADSPGPRTYPPTRHPPGSRLQHRVNERPVRILLECILVIPLIAKAFIVLWDESSMTSNIFNAHP